MSGRKIVVWRHGQTAFNNERRYQGHLDVDLDDVGGAQATRAAAMLAGLSPSAIVCSDLTRARSTADELARLVGVAVTVDKRLREIDVGAWEGLTFDEVTAKFPDEVAEWRDGREGRRGGGESLVEVAERAVAAVRDALETLPDGETLVIATHGAAGRALVASMIGLPVALWTALGSLSNCSWSVIGEAESGTVTGWRLLEYNAGTLPQPVVGDDR
ncbi:MAG: histidine phosphatase family protein [Acidothermaceae bacterium]